MKNRRFTADTGCRISGVKTGASRRKREGWHLCLRNSLLLQATKPKHWTDTVYIFVHFSSTLILILNLTMSPESQESNISNDILYKQKYSQHFMHESNIFLLKQLYQANRFTDTTQRWHHSLFIDCAQTDGQTEKQVKHDLRQFHCVLLADIIKCKLTCNMVFEYCTHTHTHTQNFTVITKD